MLVAKKSLFISVGLLASMTAETQFVLMAVIGLILVIGISVHVGRTTTRQYGCMTFFACSLVYLGLIFYGCTQLIKL
jgi:hypothetical protein